MPIARKAPARIAISMGDPAGIGAEVVLKAAAAFARRGRAPSLLVVGDLGVMRETARRLRGVPEPREWHRGEDLIPLRRGLGVLSAGSLSATARRAGRPTVEGGDASFGYVVQGARMAMRGEVDALVTAPISKQWWHRAGHHYPGHSELVSEIGRARRWRMMFVGGALRLALVTVHMGLKEVSATLTRARVFDTIAMLHQHLRGGAGSPRIAVLGFNPHAGENGLFGDEEVRAITPAIRAARRAGIDAFGPLAPDTAFIRPRGRFNFDAVVAMYHDQGLIPLKTLEFDRAVNVTLGLPFVRTSPDHGTAFDIAGAGRASPSSMIAAIDYAHRAAQTHGTRRARLYVMADKIVIKGAREHNLKSIDLAIPRDRLVVITGLSGSGKSSLAFDTIYAEGQRRYVESLSAYARQFLEQMEKPDVDSIDGLSPAISIEQKTTSHNPRSTVGTITEIHDYLRLLFARVGHAFCYNCGREITQQSVQQIVDRIMSWPEATRIHVLAPIVRDRKGEYRKELEELRRAGFVRAKIDGKLYELGEEPALNKNQRHTIEVMVDRLAIRRGIEKRLSDSLEVAFKYGQDLLKVERLDEKKGGEAIYFSQRFACVECGISYPEITPRMFSFNSPHGACTECSGIGSIMYFDPELVVQDEDLSISDGAIAPWATINYMQPVLDAIAAHYKFSLDQPWRTIPARTRKAILYGSGDEEIEFSYQRGHHRAEYAKAFEGVLQWLDRRYKETESQGVREWLEAYMNMRPCPACSGARLKKESLFVRFNNKSIAEVSAMSIKQALQFFAAPKLSAQEAEIGRLILKEIGERLNFLADVGLDYLTLERTAGTLSGGEGQRIRLATQIGSSLVGVLYILDEPSIGLHQRDNQRLLATLKRLRDLGNTVLVVEHDRETMLEADHIIDMGPGAGAQGGYLVAQGTPAQIMKNPDSLTGKYLSGELEIATPARRRTIPNRWLTVRGARENNLRDLTVQFPLGVFTCITGVSGSGKSTLILDTLYRALAQRLNRSREHAGAFKTIDGVEHLDKVIHVDQSPIGRTPRSNPATYTGLFTHIRELFAQLPDARMRGYGPGRFSFNVKGGRCEACEGDGIIRIEMHFLPDVYVTCEVCGGQRYNRDTLEIQYKGRSIAEVLNMTVAEAVEFMGSVPPIRQKLETLRDVGLDYIHLGQSATTLSGGEAQRIKLAKELSRRATGRTLYILDEPTTGLHFDDIKRLLAVLGRLADSGNTIIVIEHNLDVIKTADYVIDLGPEGGDRGGTVVAKGTPEEITTITGSHTGQSLREVLRQRAAA